MRGRRNHPRNDNRNRRQVTDVHTRGTRSPIRVKQLRAGPWGVIKEVRLE